MHRQAMFVNLAFFQGHELAANPADMSTSWRDHHWLTRLQFGPNQIEQGTDSWFRKVCIASPLGIRAGACKMDLREDNEPPQRALLSDLTVVRRKGACQNLNETTLFQSLAKARDRQKISGPFFEGLNPARNRSQVHRRCRPAHRQRAILGSHCQLP